MFQYPFPADVWGTVSDWVMVIVTFFTAIFLYRTLRSQKDVQHAQNRFLEIEQIRLREQFKPEIQYCSFNDEDENRFSHKMKKNSEILSVSVKNLSDNVAINYKFHLPENPQAEMLDWFASQPSLIKYNGHGEVHFLIRNPNYENRIPFLFHFVFTYNDLIGTKYEQRVYCGMENGVISIRSHIPEIIN